MKKMILAVSMAAVLSANASADSVKVLENDKQKVSYSFGLVLGKRMHNDLPDLNVDLFMQGVKDAMENKAGLLTDEQVADVLAKFQRDMQQEQMEKVQKLSEENSKTGADFLAKNKQKEGVVTLESGLQYKVLKEGKGPQPGPDDVVKVHYTGSLISGEVFDSSVERGQPVTFPLNGVIAGWTEALQLMPTGSKWQLYIPSNLAYGANGNRSIGPNETLLFDVELLGIEK
jgi:FKBP-type peptidyl-prolyl cis-trans isomerase FklB